MRRNYFVEGLQGAGKTTFVKQLSDYLQNYQVFPENSVMIKAKSYHPLTIPYFALR